MSGRDNVMFGERQSDVSLGEKLFKYKRYWPLFLISVSCCLLIAFLYIRNTTPKYLATTTVLVKGNENGLYTEDVIEKALQGKAEINLNNEMMTFSSSNLMRRTVAKYGYNINYYRKGRIRNTDIYNTAPFRLIADVEDTTRSHDLYIGEISAVGGLVSSDPGLDKQNAVSFKWDSVFYLNSERFILRNKRKIGREEGNFLIKWQSIEHASNELLSNLNVQPFDDKTSVLKVTLRSDNLDKGIDVLNSLYSEFYTSDIEGRRNLSESTVKFVDDRLLAISGELKGVEGTLENFQGSNQIVDIQGQSSQSLENVNETANSLKEVAVKQQLVSMIVNFFNNPSNESKLAPSSIDLEDATINSLIGKYNEALLKKQREAPLVAPNSTVMQDLNFQISSFRASILESLNSLSQNLKVRENSLRRQGGQYRNYLATLPHNERVLQEIKRKQTITEGLYLYLLQKREEAAISSTASDVPHYQQLDAAWGYGPVEPNTTNIFLFSMIMGFLLPVVYVEARSLFNEKITSIDDLAKRTNFRVVGQLSHVPRKQWHVFSVGGRTPAAEQFRSLRTNVQFLLKEAGGKTIMVTSSVSNEGKSFVSLNLAAVCSIPDKKVALLEFDIRQPFFSEVLGNDNQAGITSFLLGEVDELSEIVHRVDSYPTLDIYTAGPIPQNPSDLMLSNRLGMLMRLIKSQYDYVVVDTSPAGLVSDSFVLSEFCDIVLYVVRNRVTTRKQLNAIKEYEVNKRLKNIALVLNDVKPSESYGYPPGYGYGIDNKKKKKSKYVRYDQGQVSQS